MEFKKLSETTNLSVLTGNENIAAFTLDNVYFTVNLLKDFILNGLNFDDRYAFKDHLHNQYALADHDHPQYALKTYVDVTFALVNHNHDDKYSPLSHIHSDYATIVYVDSTFSPLTHNHDAVYSKIIHSHNEYALVDHLHDDLYSPLSHLHDDRYSQLNHDHSQYALKTYVDTTFAVILHNHDSRYSLINHTHNYRFGLTYFDESLNDIDTGSEIVKHISLTAIEQLDALGDHRVDLSIYLRNGGSFAFSNYVNGVIERSIVRGKNTLDLSRSRTDISNTTIGENSVILSGSDNKITSKNSAVAFGSNNTIDNVDTSINNHSLIISGDGNNITSMNSTVIKGDSNTITDDNVTIQTGYNVNSKIGGCQENNYYNHEVKTSEIKLAIKSVIQDGTTSNLITSVNGQSKLKADSNTLTVEETSFRLTFIVARTADYVEDLVNIWTGRFTKITNFDGTSKVLDLIINKLNTGLQDITLEINNDGEYIVHNSQLGGVVSGYVDIKHTALMNNNFPVLPVNYYLTENGDRIVLENGIPVIQE